MADDGENNLINVSWAGANIPVGNIAASWASSPPEIDNSEIVQPTRPSDTKLLRQQESGQTVVVDVGSTNIETAPLEPKRPRSSIISWHNGVAREIALPDHVNSHHNTTISGKPSHNDSSVQPESQQVRTQQVVEEPIIENAQSHPVLDIKQLPPPIVAATAAAGMGTAIAGAIPQLAPFLAPTEIEKISAARTILRQRRRKRRRRPVTTAGIPGIRLSDLRYRQQAEAQSEKHGDAPPQLAQRANGDLAMREPMRLFEDMKRLQERMAELLQSSNDSLNAIKEKVGIWQ